jgi:hypothetical protein
MPAKSIKNIRRKHQLLEEKPNESIACLCGANIHKQPWMTPADWTVAVREFKERHG